MSVKSRNPAFLLEKYRLLTVLTWAAVTKCHRLSGLKNKHFSQFWRQGSLRSDCQCGQGLTSGRGLSSWLADTRKCVLPWPKEAALVSSSSYEGKNPIMEAVPSWPHLNPVTSQSTPDPVPSHWELGLQYMNFRGIQMFSP